MPIIADSSALKTFCQNLRGADFITVDTEFLRDQTYWPKLCLVQVGGPEGAVAVDPLAPGLDLAPLADLFHDESLLKVFHSARQDLEIFFHRFDRLPHPIFDTQIAAMVCGFGDSVGYDTLVRRLTGKRIDKGPRFTDWSRRPLSDAQLSYALDDVIHLRDVYRALAKTMRKRSRERWLDEEMEILTSPETYRLEPETAWRRLKTRSSDRRYLAVLKALATWREHEAQRRDVPRNRVLRDEQLFDIAAQLPRTPEELSRARSINADTARGRFGRALLEAVQEGLAVAPEDRPRTADREDFPADLGPVVDILKILLKKVCTEQKVAAKLIANGGELERIAAGHRQDVPALTGWRFDIFGKDALRLIDGKLALRVRGGKVELTQAEQMQDA
jgi:ribonuclease D